MVTTLNDIVDRIKALEVEADDFLNKPVDKYELKARVQSLIKIKKYNDYMKNYQAELEREVKQRTHELNQALGKIRTNSIELVHKLMHAGE